MRPTARRVHGITEQRTRPQFAAQTHLVLVMAATGTIDDAVRGHGAPEEKRTL